MQADLEDLKRDLLLLQKEPDLLAVAAPAVVVSEQRHLHILWRLAEEAQSRLRAGSAMLVVRLLVALLVQEHSDLLP